MTQVQFPYTHVNLIKHYGVVHERYLFARTMFMLAVAGVLLTTGIPLYGQSVRKADHYFDFKTLRDNRGEYSLTPSGSREYNVKIDSKTDRRTSNDGAVYTFDGSNWLTLKDSGGFIPEKKGTVAIRFFSEKSGGIIHTDRMSVLVHESGLLLIVVAVRDSRGTMFREIPFDVVAMNSWHDLVIRYEGDKIDVVFDGVQHPSVALGGTVSSIRSGNAFIGKWRIERLPLQSFPEHIVGMLFEKRFKGQIDHAAVWKKRISDQQVADICDVPNLRRLIPSVNEETLSAYRQFHIASRAGDTATTIALGRQMRAAMSKDARRPSYHLTAPLDAILDPAGAFFYAGKYHVFSYRNMSSLLAATPLVHYVSDDLIHWKDFPISVWPDSDDDVFGIWLGNLVIENGLPRMLYTALGQHGKYGVLATTDSLLLSFSAKQVVISDFVHHDGHAWRDGDEWKALTTKQYWGTRAGDQGDAIIMLSSKDLRHWKVEGEIFQTSKLPDGRSDEQKMGFTEYPYLIPFGEKFVLMTGTRPARYWIGRFDPKLPAFIPDHAEGKLLDHLNTFHCFNPSTIDNNGPNGGSRRIIEAMHLYASGNANGLPWYGVHTIPRVLSLEGDRLVQNPVDEIKRIRGIHQHISKRDIVPEKMLALKGGATEIIATFNRRNSSQVGLKLGADHYGKNGVNVYFDTQYNTFNVTGDFKKPADFPELGHCESRLKPEDLITFRILIDHSFFEIFVNGETFTGVFSGEKNRENIYVFADGGTAELIGLDRWEMLPAMVPR